MQRKIYIFGAGGFAKEVYTLMTDIGISNSVEAFIESDNIWKEREILGVPVKPLSSFDPATHEMVVAIGNPESRRKIVYSLPVTSRFPVLIHPSVIISKWVCIGEGSIICAGSVLTADIILGKHTQINLCCTIGHDFQCGDFFTTAPSVNISGKCYIGEEVYIGTNACIRENIHIASGTTIGMGSVVVKDINQPGTYAGNPARLINL